METYKNLKKGTKIGLIITAVLTVLGLVFVLFDLVIALPKSLTSPNPYSKVHNIITTIMCATMIAYALIGYKKPYGNTLKHTMMFFGFCVLLQNVFPSPRLNDAEMIIERLCSGAAAMMIFYMAGRLNKLKANKKYMVLIGVLITISRTFIVFARGFYWVRGISNLAIPIIWAALCFAYVARFEEHKAAGLADKADA